MIVWKTLTSPTRQEWLDMAIECHASGREWAMWLSLLLWASKKDDCAALGVCQGYKSPCIDCPKKV